MKLKNGFTLNRQKRSTTLERSLYPRSIQMLRFKTFALKETRRSNVGEPIESNRLAFALAQKFENLAEQFQPERFELRTAE